VTRIHSYIEALMLVDERPLVLGDGEVLFREGERGEQMYIVRSGELELRSGRRRLEVVGPGGLVGEMALIDPAPRSATAVARGEASVAAVDANTFDELVRRVPRLALEVMRIVTRRLRRTTPLAAGPRRPTKRRAGAMPRPAAKRRPGGRARR
jgi:CRP/FNR family transcriptional regulator, cyclic AMP receptor protein